MIIWHINTHSYGCILKYNYKQLMSKFYEENTNYHTKDYINFLNGKLCTENGKTYSEIINYTSDDLENDHKFIQWIFPTTQPSDYAKNVPIIDIAELQTFIRDDPTIIEKLKQSYNLMIKHWGLDDIQCIKNMEKLNGHNALRLSRMLQSLVYHNQKSMALLTYEIVSQHIGDDNDDNFILNPLMYYGTDLENMKSVGYMYNTHNIHNTKGIFMDVWKYHLLKACKEFENLV